MPTLPNTPPSAPPEQPEAPKLVEQQSPEQQNVKEAVANQADEFRTSVETYKGPAVTIDTTGGRVKVAALPAAEAPSAEGPTDVVTYEGGGVLIERKPDVAEEVGDPISETPAGATGGVEAAAPPTESLPASSELEQKLDDAMAKAEKGTTWGQKLGGVIAALGVLVQMWNEAMGKLSDKAGDEAATDTDTKDKPGAPPESGPASPSEGSPSSSEKPKEKPPETADDRGERIRDELKASTTDSLEKFMEEKQKNSERDMGKVNGDMNALETEMDDLDTKNDAAKKQLRDRRQELDDPKTTEARKEELQLAIADLNAEIASIDTKISSRKERYESLKTKKQSIDEETKKDIDYIKSERAKAEGKKLQLETALQRISRAAGGIDANIATLLEGIGLSLGPKSLDLSMTISPYNFERLRDRLQQFGLEPSTKIDANGVVKNPEKLLEDINALLKKLQEKGPPSVEGTQTTQARAPSETAPASPGTTPTASADAELREAAGRAWEGKGVESPQVFEQELQRLMQDFKTESQGQETGRGIMSDLNTLFVYCPEDQKQAVAQRILNMNPDWQAKGLEIQYHGQSFIFETIPKQAGAINIENSGAPAPEGSSVEIRPLLSQETVRHVRTTLEWDRQQKEHSFDADKTKGTAQDVIDALDAEISFLKQHDPNLTRTNEQGEFRIIDRLQEKRDSYQKKLREFPGKSGDANPNTIRKSKETNARTALENFRRSQEGVYDREPTRANAQRVLNAIDAELAYLKSEGLDVQRLDASGDKTLRQRLEERRERYVNALQKVESPTPKPEFVPQSPKQPAPQPAEQAQADTRPEQVSPGGPDIPSYGSYGFGI